MERKTCSILGAHLTPCLGARSGDLQPDGHTQMCPSVPIAAEAG